MSALEANILPSVPIAPTVKPKRSYSDPEKAEALALLATGASFKKVARETGIPDSTIYAWSKGLRLTDEAKTLETFKKQQLSDKFASIAHKFLDLTYEQTGAIKPESWMTGAGIATEKYLLLTGQATSIVGITEDERQLRLAELLVKLESRAEQPDPKI